MLLSHSRISLLLLFLAVVSAQSIFKKQYYIDPNSQGSESGHLELPFHSLNSALTLIEDEISKTPTDQSIDVVISCKEGTTLTLSDPISFTLNNLERSSSSVKINTYSANNNGEGPQPATLLFKSPSAHLSISATKTKLMFQGFHIRLEVTEKLNNPELVLIKVPYGEVTFAKCDFSDIQIGNQEVSVPIFRFNGGRYLVKSCSFGNLNLVGPLFEIQETPKGLLKFEFNDFHNLVATNFPLVKANNISSIDFIENKVQEIGGKLIQVNLANYVIFSNNTFLNTQGEASIEITTVRNIILSDNSFSYEPKNSEARGGLLSLTNFDILFINNNTLKGYSGSISPINLNVDKSYSSRGESVIKLIGSTFSGNALIMKDVDSPILSLLNFKSDNKFHIYIKDTLFTGNQIVDQREIKKAILGAASTISLQAEDSILQIQNSSFTTNKASRSLNNLYVNAHDVSVKESQFTANTHIKADDSSKDDELAFKSFLWFGEAITFQRSDFRENYADEGGAIGIYETGNLPVADYVIIKECNFTQNQAKVGGAIFTDVESHKLSAIQLKDVQFKDNKADRYSNYNPNPKFNEGGRLKIYMEVTQVGIKTTYESDEFTLNDLVSDHQVDLNFLFYVAELKNTPIESSDQYITSVQLSEETQIEEGEEVVLVESVKDKETGSSYEIKSLTMKAPVGSENKIKVTMARKDNPSQVLTFEFYVNMIKKEISCKRGEYYLHEKKYCVKCPAGTYSLNENTLKCTPCPVGADCSRGGDQIFILPGHWRDVAGVGVPMIFKCLGGDSHCLGGVESKCEKGYTGTLCNTCDRGGSGTARYRPFLPNTCKKCEATILEDIFGDLIAFTVPIVILLYTVYALISVKEGLGNNAETSRKRFSLCLYINLFITYGQNLFILNTLGFISMPAAVLTFINVLANPSYATFGHLTCYIDVDDNSFMKVLGLFSLVLVVKALMLFFALKFIARSVSMTRTSSVTLIWLAFLEAPGFLDFVLRLFDCQQLGNNVYSRFNLGPQCSSETFNNVRLYILLPLVVLIALTIPLAATYSLVRGSLRNDTDEEQKRLRVMVLAKSSEHIVKSERNWLYFYYNSFARLGLLLLVTSQDTNLSGFIVAVLYYVSLFFMSVTRRVASFDGWRSAILSVDSFVLITNLVSGSIINLIDNDLKSYFTNTLWSINALYIAVVFAFRLVNTSEVRYGKLESNHNSSSNGFDVSSDEQYKVDNYERDQDEERAEDITM